MRKIRIVMVLVGVLTLVLLQTNGLLAKKMTLNILCWEGYTKPYTEGFTKLMKEKYKLDVKFNINNISAPQEFWTAARLKQADLISPAHNILKSDKWKFIKGGIALPVDLNNIPNYKNLLPFLRKNPFVTHEGDVFAVPYTMGPYGLAYNAEKVERPVSWEVLWDEESKNKFTISKDYPDCNIYVASLVLGANYEDLYNFETLKNTLEQDELQPD